MTIPRSFLALLIGLVSTSAGRAQVIINEMASASNERVLKWSSSGVPTLGTGINWNAVDFTDTTWTAGNLPAGWGSTVSTNLQNAMLNKTPSLYLRKSFTVSATDAARTTPVILQVEYDDGFVAYLNGQEVARMNAGPVNHFLYVGQPAYNANLQGGLLEITLGAANTLLQTGTNVLAIQAHNATLSSNFRINAGLKIRSSNANITVVKANYDFNAANDASRTHTNTGGVITNTASGTPVAGGWLATAADPVSDVTWTSLQVVTGERAGVGYGGTGGLRYNFAQSGINRAVAVRAPAVNMAGAWSSGGLSPAILGTTTVSFRYRTTSDLIFGLRMDPALGQAGNSLDGLPVLGGPLAGTANIDWNAASGGQNTVSINATGGTNSSSSGNIDISKYNMFYGFYGIGAPATTCRSGSMIYKEDATAGIGPGGTSGVLSWTFTTWPATVDSLGLRIKGLIAAGWVAPNITAADFQKTRLSFRWKLPVGRRIKMRMEPSSSVTAANQMELGSFVGTDNWETFSATLADLPNAAAYRTRMNAAGTTGSLVMYYDGVPFANGEKVLLDTLSLYVEQAGANKEENPVTNYGAVAGAARSLSVDATGTQTPATTGTPITNFVPYADPSVRGFAMSAVEDGVANGGNSGLAGFLRCSVTDAADVAGPWGIILPGFQVRNWPVGTISAANLSEVLLQFAAKIPSGVTVSLFAEPTGGSTANRAIFAPLTGTGTWQTYTREFATATNIENFRTALNAATTTTFQLNFAGAGNEAVGDIFSLDDLEVATWRTYSTLLSAGTNQQRFLDYLNLNELLTFIPTFSKNGPVGANGAALYLDNFSVSYFGLDPAAVVTAILPGANGGAWKYFVGIAEPSGGLYDPALITATVIIPQGEENDYGNPQNFRDWIELKNTTGSPINLTGWSLSDTLDTPSKWKFPVAGSTIAANGYLIVMCDNRDETNGIGLYLHSNFSLSSSGGTVRLYNPAGALVSEVAKVPEQDAFHTWAINPATGIYGFTDLGTPNAPNAGTFAVDRASAPDFKTSAGAILPGGFYTGTQTVILNTPTPSATIRYTMDGSDPTETTGSLYTTPLVLTPVNNKTGRVVRAATFRPGWLPSKTKVHTFLIDQDASLRTLPALIFSGNQGRNFYLPQGIMAISGGVYNGGWTANGPSSYNIPFNRGDAYERLISAEYYYPDGSDGWREDVGIRLSRSPFTQGPLRFDQTSSSPWPSDYTQKPSFNLYWRSDYGNSSLKHATIPDNDIREYKQFRIRAGKNDPLNPFIVDELGRHLYREMGWFSPIGVISSLYINGSFKGIYNPTERLRGSMFQGHYHTSNEFDVNYVGEMVDGDATFWNSTIAALDTLGNAPTLANYNAVQNYLDVVNAADYFLACIYVNYDDWPWNNWAAQRERAPQGRYRLAMWDAEAAWGRFGKAVNYDTIGDKLLSNSGGCSVIFYRLYQSPEFRLLFADRIQKFMFNGGILDDRGANSHVKKVKDALLAQATPLIQFISNPGSPTSVAIDMNWYNTMTDPATGRRAFLFNTAATTGSFRNKLLWPNTEPPTFSQFGGVTGANYPLAISHSAPAGSVIYYTTDGSDPRLVGGGVSPTALVYSGALVLNTVKTIRSRVLSNTGEWSPLTEATFQPGSVAPTGSNLVVSEIMYHPPDPTSAETAAGFLTAEDFEFLRFTNISATALDLRQLQITSGVTFNFAMGSVPALAPGDSVLIVKRKVAFEKRYGIAFSAKIAGEFAGSLSNTGERIKIVWGMVAPLTTIQDFTYLTKATDTAWPMGPDGYGPSLVLANLSTSIFHGVGGSWRCSAQPGGIPGGGARAMNYATWRSLSFDAVNVLDAAVSGPGADPDGDGLTNFEEYTFGSVPMLADSAEMLPQGSVVHLGNEDYLAMEYRIVGGASDASVTPQRSAALATWLQGAADIITVSGPTAMVDGSIHWKVRSAVPISSGLRGFLRLGLTGL